MTRPPGASCAGKSTRCSTQESPACLPINRTSPFVHATNGGAASNQMLQPFHLAIPVHSLSAARSFYGGLFGCPEGRSSEQWVDFDFFGHQLVAHLDPGRKPHVHHNPVDGHDVPVPHFGVVLEWQAWHALAQRLRQAGTRFRNRTGHPLRGPGRRAGDDVSLRSVRQCARVQGVQGSCAAVCEVASDSREVRRSARLTSFAAMRSRKFAGDARRSRSSSLRSSARTHRPARSSGCACAPLNSRWNFSASAGHAPVRSLRG